MARERYLVNAGEDTIHQNQIQLVTAKDKGKNWWYYHKIHLLVGVLAVALVGSFLYSMFTKVSPDYTIALLTSYTMPETGLNQLEDYIAAYADDRNGDGQVSINVTNYVYDTSADADYAQREAAIVRFMADASSNEVMIYLHDGGAFSALEGTFEGFFQYTDGTPMEDDATDFENAMTSWQDMAAFANFQPASEEGELYTGEVLTELYSRLRVSCRAAEGSSIESSEKDMEYYQSSMALFQRLKDDEPLQKETASEEG